MTALPLLEARGITKRLGGRLVVDGVDLAVAAGEVVCVIGPSGCGKSTLLRCLDFLVEPDGGWVRLEGQPIGMISGPRGNFLRDREANVDLMRRRIGFVAQQFNLWPHLTALENVTKGPETVLRQSRSEAQSRGKQLLARVRLADKADAYPAELSGGQQGRVAIARALAMDPTLLLLDEPTASLDPELIGEVLAVLTELRQAGMTMVVVTHELNFAARAADWIVFMDHGKVVETGEPLTLLRQPRSDRLKRFLADVRCDDLESVARTA